LPPVNVGKPWRRIIGALDVPVAPQTDVRRDGRF
jgi:hypothetical protein